MIKTVIVTGCLGFIGSHLTSRLLSEGYKVYGIDKETYAANLERLEEFRKFENFTYEKADICELEDIPNADWVLNLCAETHVGRSIIDSKDFIRTNVDGVRNLLTIIHRKPENIRKRPIFCHFGTDEEFGDLKEERSNGYGDDAPLKPSNAYSASKCAASMLIQAFHRTYGLEYVIVRPSNNFGKFQHNEKLIPLAVKMLSEGKRIRLHDKGEPRRMWLHVEDTVDAVLAILQYGKINNCYNIGGFEECKNIDLVKLIVEKFEGFKIDWNIENVEKYFDFSYKRPGQDVRYFIDDSKLRSLGWLPKRKIEDTIEDIVQFYKKNWRW